MGMIKMLFDLFGTKNTTEVNPKVVYDAPVATKPKTDYIVPGWMVTLDDAEKSFKAYGLQQYFEPIKPFIRQRIDIEITPAKEELMDTGSSKFGGQPDLLPDADWPQTDAGEPLSFIAQLNCAEISALDDSGLMPKSGLLSFFYSADQSAWGFDPKDKDKFCVLYSKETASLGQKVFPAVLPEDARYIADAIVFNKTLSLPDWEHHIVLETVNEKDSDDYDELSMGVTNQVFGYPSRIQGEMELECEQVTHGLYRGDATGYQDPKAKDLEGGTSDWVLLLQVGSEDEKTGMMWGDAGNLYFWIRKQDLADERFDKAWCILQCY